MSDTLLVTVVIGPLYQRMYKALFYENHKAFARKFGYDIHVVTDFLDKKQAHSCFISLQKSLVCSQAFSARYNKLIYVDADILFNLQNASPHDLLVDNEKIYIADEFSQPSPNTRLEIQRLNNWERTATEYYALADLVLETESVLNTGFMVLCPDLHKNILEDIYAEATRIGFNHPRGGFHFEQAMIGYAFQKNNCWKALPNEWNALWAIQKMAPGNTTSLSDFFAQNKAVHFAGKSDLNLIPELQANRY